jgi:hypothetical protein
MSCDSLLTTVPVHNELHQLLGMAGGIDGCI